MAQWQHFEGRESAHVGSDAQGHVAVQWEYQGELSPESDGWREGDRLFVPTDGQLPLGYCLDDAGQPDPLMGWYDVETGHPAIIGLPGGRAVFA